MDLNLTPDEQQFRDEFRAWLRENVFAAKTVDELKRWQRTLFEGGWAGVSWPKQYGGRGATLMQQAIFQEELALADAPQLIGVIGLSLVGPTIIAMGTDEQKAQHLSKILSGEEIWCQGFSEPNAGSDLASLGTRALRDGDDFIVNGQKIWTSFAHIADWCLLLVRTDFEAPKHKGITCLLADMHAPGVTVRPLRMMSGDAGFNEVFFDNVRVTPSQVLGKVNEGWTTAITALMNERANLGTGVQVIFRRNLNALMARSHTIDRNGKPFGIPRADVRQVQVIHGKAQKGKWALIGAGVGAGVGATIGYAKYSPESDDSELWVPVGLMFGAGGGALSGLLFGQSTRKRVMVYDAR